MNICHKRKYNREYMHDQRHNPVTRDAFLKHNRDWSRAHRKKNRLKLRMYAREYGKRKRLEVLGRRKRCAICGKRRQLVLDHSHTFAKKNCTHNATLRKCQQCRRGALCYSCNQGVAVLEKFGCKARQYVEKWNKKLIRRWREQR